MFILNFKKILLIFLAFIFLIPSCAIKERLEQKPVVTYNEKPPELLWEDATRYLKRQNYTEAAVAFEEIDKQHPYSKLAKQSKMMAAYAYYLNKDYENSIFAIQRFISLHPADKNMPYVLYLQGLCYYDQIHIVALDQNPSLNAKKVFTELINPAPTLSPNPPPCLYVTVKVVFLGDIPRVLVFKRLFGSIVKDEKTFLP